MTDFTTTTVTDIEVSVHGKAHQGCHHLTRADGQKLTKQRLMNTGQELVATKGLAATTPADLSVRASYLRGAFYSNVICKHDLVI